MRDNGTRSHDRERNGKLEITYWKTIPQIKNSKVETRKARSRRTRIEKANSENRCHRKCWSEPVDAPMPSKGAAPTHELGSQFSSLDFPVPVFAFRIPAFRFSGSCLLPSSFRFVISYVVPNVLPWRYFEWRSWSDSTRVSTSDFRFSNIRFSISSLHQCF